MESDQQIQTESLQKDYYVLTADIGGTNFRLRLSKITYYQQSQLIERLEKYFEKIYMTKKYESFAKYIDLFLEEKNVEKEQVKKIVMAIRGFQQGKCFQEFQNESQESLKSHFNDIPDVVFMNDVEGMAQSMIYSQETRLDQEKEELFVELKHDRSPNLEYQNPQVKILFTMGTGTGVSFLLPYPYQKKSLEKINVEGETQNQIPQYQHIVLPSEAWASYLSADSQKPLQSACSEYLFRKMKTRTSLVKFLKGPTLLNLYQFMKEREPELANEGTVQKTKKAIKKLNKDREVGQQEAITYLAVNGEDPLCEKTIDFLIQIFASYLQRIALTALPYGGIYIGGGVGNYIATYIVKKQDIFWQNFLDLPVMKECVLEKIPIFVMKENPTLDGLEAYILHNQTPKNQ